MELAGFMQDYAMRGQHTADRAMTRVRHDLPKMAENNEISTGPGRYRLGVPNAYGNAVFVPDVTTRMQKWGASHDMTSTKTDVESDLWNIGRPTTRTVCGQYMPEEGAAVAARLTSMPEADFPQTHARLVDPPCTLRGSGWNRWEWLCDNPQENVMMPFAWALDTRHANKDQFHRKLMSAPLGSGPVARDNQLVCNMMYMDPAVPVARPRGPGQPQTFSDVVPGSLTQSATGAPPAARFTPRGGPQTGGGYPDAPTIGPVANPLDRNLAITGILEPPAPFTAYIAPH